ncbi:MAG: hypothetical protein M3406_15440 [Chloroflexota bacterium]|nr:hypothetical protein [Chloroflexota bacterium]
MDNKTNRILLTQESDGSYVVNELTQDELDARLKQQAGREEFLHLHGINKQDYMNLWHGQSQLCAACSQPVAAEDAFYEESDSIGLACPACSITLTIRRDNERLARESAALAVIAAEEERVALAALAEQEGSNDV